MNCQTRVMVMRESRIDYYRPGFRVPLYPWVPLVGVLVPVWLIAEMGWLAVLFTAAVGLAALAWYMLYARQRVQRTGAVYHIFARLGQQAWIGLDTELRLVLAERGLRRSDEFETLVSHAVVADVERAADLDEAIAIGCERLAADPGIQPDEIASVLQEGTRLGWVPVARGVALPHMRSHRVNSPRLALVRLRRGATVAVDEGTEQVRAVMILISPEAHPGRHLRVLARLAERIDRDDFLPAWRAASGPAELKELLLRDAYFFALTLDPAAPSGALVGQRATDCDLPDGALVAFIRRGGQCFVPRAGQLLEPGDRLTVIGEPLVLERLQARFDPRGASPSVPPGEAPADDTT